MVKYQDTALDRTFAALSDATRRALLARLNDNDGLSVSELAQPFSMSLPAVMKHLDVLSDAGLVTRSKTGRTVSCALKAAPMEDAMQWLNRYQRFWTSQLDRLAAFVEEDSCPPTQPPTPPSTPVSPSNVVSMRSPEKVYAAWTEPTHLTQWFGPEGGVVERAELNVRPGGRYTIVFHTQDGEQHHVSGVYKEVVPNEKLAFTWAWRSTPERESYVTVMIKSDGPGCMLTLIHEKFFDEAARDRHNTGWTGALNKLEKLFA